MEKGKGGILRSEKNGGVSGGAVSRDQTHVSFSIMLKQGQYHHELKTIPLPTMVDMIVMM